MIGAVNTLLRVKKVREEKALAWMRSRRDAVEAAEQLVAEAKAAVQLSKQTMPEREAELWKPIIQKVVDMDAIDDVEAAVKELEAAHQRLKDRATRADHTLEKRREELAEATEAHKRAQAAVDKYEMLRDEVKAEADAEAAYAEEVELEDLAGRKVAPVA
ncbi:MAG: YscO family type III secretion system apparatus protein [Pseudomonadota bacterium]